MSAKTICKLCSGSGVLDTMHPCLCQYNSPEDSSHKKVRNPIVVSKWFRTSREDRTVNQRYDATCTVTWNVELGPKHRPWLHLYLNEFQMVFTLRLRYRGHTIFEKIQSQDWEPKNRKWMFNHWLFDQLEDRYQDYEHSLPEDPYYGSISMYE